MYMYIYIYINIHNYIIRPFLVRVSTNYIHTWDDWDGQNLPTDFFTDCLLVLIWPIWILLYIYIYRYIYNINMYIYIHIHLYTYKVHPKIHKWILVIVTNWLAQRDDFARHIHSVRVATRGGWAARCSMIVGTHTKWQFWEGKLWYTSGLSGGQSFQTKPCGCEIFTWKNILRVGILQKPAGKWWQTQIDHVWSTLFFDQDTSNGDQLQHDQVF